MVHNPTNKFAGGFTAGTLIHTLEGQIPIAQIKVGDRVLSKRGNGEGQTEYKRVLDTLQFDSQEVYEISYYSVSNPSRRHVLVATGNHSFWVKGIKQSILDKLAEDGKANPWKNIIGWNRLDHITGGVELFELADGTAAFTRSSGSRLIQKTLDPEVGFVLADRKADDGYLIDFRNGVVKFQEDELVWAHSIDPEGLVEEYLATVYNIEIEDFHTYFVGELGVLVDAIA